MYCRVHQWVISRSMDSRPSLAWPTKIHLRRCAACRRFHARCLALADALTDDARRMAPQVGRELHGLSDLRMGMPKDQGTPGTHVI